MLPEDHVVVQVDHIHYVFWVVLLQELQDFKLHTSLIVVLFLIFDDFHGHIDTMFVVEAFQSRSKRAFTKEGLNFKSEANVVIVDHLVVTLVVIVAIIVLQLGAALDLLGCRRPNEVDLWVVEDLTLLVIGQLV